MELADYRKWKGLSLKAMAELVGMSNASAVLKQETGQTMPRPEVLEAYHRVTNGAVTAEDFVRVALRYRAQQSQSEQSKAA